MQFCSVSVQHAAHEGNIVFNINVSKYNTRFNAGDLPEVANSFTGRFMQTYTFTQHRAPDD